MKMNRKGNIFVTSILSFIVIVIMLVLLYNFSQGTSGTLRKVDDTITVTANSTNYNLAEIPSNTATVRCGNTTALTLNTDYSLSGKSIRYYGNSTGQKCGTISGSNTIYLQADYDYYSSLYISSGNSLVRTIMSYVAVAFALAILVFAFLYWRK